MLSEFRNSILTPVNYYDLYLDITRKLQFIEDFFERYLKKKDSSMTIANLYEKVQYIGNIVPRLYLLITMGSLYIKSREKSASSIISDLVNMVKGVQHPTRGLFLRLYMTQKLKDKLPDKNSLYGNDYDSSISFLIQNFMDTVNLFCRLRSDWRGEKRERERKQLTTLIGQNLERLSQLESINTQIYSTSVLPDILTTIIKYKDIISQEHLMLCTVSAFPDEYHIATLTMILDAITRLQSGVDVKTILISLIDRLNNYAKNFPESIPEDIKIIELFNNSIHKISQVAQPPAEILLEIQDSLLGLSLTIHQGSIEHVNQIVEGILNTLPVIEISRNNSVLQERLRTLITDTLIQSLTSVLNVLEIKRFGELIEYLNFSNRKYVSNELVLTVIDQSAIFSDSEQISNFFNLIDSLIKDQQDGKEDTNSEAFEQEQSRVASLLHNCENEDTDALFKIYISVRKFFGTGGDSRIKYTLVPLLFAFLKLADRIQKNTETKRATIEKVFEICTQTLQVLSKFESDLSFNLYLQVSIAADKHYQTPYTIEMLTQALLLFENFDSTKKYDALITILNTLHVIHNLDTDNLTNYISNACQATSKLILKTQQCKLALYSSLLYYPRNDNPIIESKEKALARLQTSTRIVKECRKPQQLPLLIEILNVYLIHFESNNELVTSQFINGLLDLIRDNIEEARSDDFGPPEIDGQEKPLSVIKTYFEQTRNYISRKKHEERFSEIKF